MTQASDQAAQEFLSGKLASVNVAKIEKELAQFWKEAAHGSADADTAPVLRACSFNLILITDEDDAETKCSDLLDEIEEHHPCRSILAVYRPQRPQHQLSAWVSARCHTASRSKQICSEQVTVCCDNGKPDELASVVLPLVLPDLPVFMWWRQSRIDWRELEPLHGSANKFIFDSGRQPFAANIFIDAWKLVAENRDNLIVADLNWRRMQGWRRAIADSFDGFPLPVDFLNRIQRVALTISGKTAPFNRALLLAGWLASRLQWKPKSFVPHEKAIFTCETRTIEVVFNIDKAEEGNHFQQTLIEFEGDQRQLVIEPERTAEARFITARLSDDGETEATRVANILAETVLVGQELEVLSRDGVFESSLEMVAALCGLKG
jgi:glucose-6-phosphate dehydrogenase assembly protein OpcA